MVHAANGLSVKDLVAQAKANGRHVSADQVVRWHKAGLVPRPVRKARGRGKGSESLGYPREALHHVQAVSWLLRLGIRRDLKWVGWMMWLAGYPVTPVVRRVLAELADRYATELARMGEELTSDTPTRSPRDLFKRAALAAGLKAFGVAPQRFRGPKREEFDTALVMVVQLLNGAIADGRDLDMEGLDALVHGLAGGKGLTPDMQNALRALRTPTLEEAPRVNRNPGKASQATRDRERARDALRQDLVAISRSVAAGLLQRRLNAKDDRSLEEAREDCITIWLVEGTKTNPLGVLMGPPPELFLVWYWYRTATQSGRSAFPGLRDETGRLAINTLLSLFRYNLKQYGLPLPMRSTALATLLPLSLEEHPDAHLICRPIETGKRRRGRRQRVRTPRRRGTKSSGH